MPRPQDRRNFDALAALTDTFLAYRGGARRRRPVAAAALPMHVRPGALRALQRMLTQTLAWPLGVPLGVACSEPRIYQAADGRTELAFVLRPHRRRGESDWAPDHDPEGARHVLLLGAHGQGFRQGLDRDAGEDAAWTATLPLSSLADPVLRGPTRPEKPRVWQVSNHHTEPLYRRMVAELTAVLEAPGAYGTPESLLAEAIQECIHADQRALNAADEPVASWLDEIVGGSVAGTGLNCWKVLCHTRRTESEDGPPYPAEVRWEGGTGRIFLDFEASSGPSESGLHVFDP
jgi:hypothetical protein